MRFFLLIIFISCRLIAESQSITPAQQKALNSYMDYANWAGEEVSNISVSVIKHYTDLVQQQEKKLNFVKTYQCPFREEEYYIKEALAAHERLTTYAVPLKQKFNVTQESFNALIHACRDLETYYKLEDYKSDSFKKANDLITTIPELIEKFKKDREDLIDYIRSVYEKLNVTSTACHLAAREMQEEMKTEREFLNSWKYNVHDKLYTGWDEKKLESSIEQTTAGYKQLTLNSSIKYPASSSFSSFKAGLSSMLSNKQKALDNFNASAKTSDKFSNDLYLNLINYYNGTLVSFYNKFVEYAQQQNYHGLKEPKYVIGLEIRRKEKNVTIDISPYQDISYLPVNPPTSSAQISLPVAGALNQYIELINKSVHEVKWIRLPIRNLNRSAVRLRNLSSFEGKGSLHYAHDDFEIPFSLMKQIEGNAAIPIAYRKSLNNQAAVLIRILKEMEQLNALLEQEVSQKHYEKDNLNNLYAVFERFQTLYDQFDEKKQILYHDVAAVYDSYSQPAAALDSWNKSGKALRNLVEADYVELKKAKAVYLQQSSELPAISGIDQHVREVISEEYDNLKGIEKLGRNNGRCPYTAYEDIPKDSKTLAEKLQQMKQPDSHQSDHPYHSMLYLYNMIVDDYNKFSDLSGKHLLKNVNQLEISEVYYPDSEKPSRTNQKIIIPAPIKEPVSTASVNSNNPVAEGSVLRDTIYIEKHDTIYIHEADIMNRSMEGYAINNLVLLLDVSGSMNTPDKLPLLKKSVLQVLSMMRKEDQVAILVYSGKAKVLLPSTSFQDEEKIKRVIENLETSGKTDGNAGIKLAYQVADKSYIRGGNNRIILATDGDFPISDKMYDLVTQFSKQDIILTVFNFRSTNNPTKRLEELAKHGGGNLEYITQENAEYKFVRELKAKKL